ncbi:MAG TPA: hypothetical protein VK795_07020 [Terriglobales bacterium]|nr:hypothetical protein [Terriglobales bacterium]
MHPHRPRCIARSIAPVALLLAIAPIAHGQKQISSRNTQQAGPQPEIEIESPHPASHKSHKKDPTGTAVQLRYRILPSTAGVTSARIEIWDRPDLLVKIPVRVAKTGELTWTDTSAPAPSRLDFTLIDPAAIRACAVPCAEAGPSFEPPATTVAGQDVPPSFRSDPVRVQAGSESLTLELDGRFLTPSTKVLLGEPTPKKEIWKAWEFLPAEFIDVTKMRATIPWSYLASAHTLVLWPLNLDETDSAEGNGLALNGTEQRTPLGGGSPQIVYVAGATSPTLNKVEPETLPADASDRNDAKLLLHGSGFTQKSQVVIGLDPLESNVLHAPPVVLAPKLISPQELEVQIPSSQLRRTDVAYSERGPIRAWVRNSDTGFQISESQDIKILPTDKLPPVPLAGEILAINPSPLPLMTASGPQGIEVTVVGRNFRANDTVLATVDQSAKTKLQTQFVSPTELRVSIPREIWRDHRVSYRFVIVTPQGERATELFEDEDAPESDSESTK